MLSNRAAVRLTAPALTLFALLLVWPLLFLLRVSLLPSAPGAALAGPLSVSAYGTLIDPYVARILLRTLRIAGLTTICCLVLGYPLAISVAPM